jgi:GDP-L-fucose synthase
LSEVARNWICRIRWQWNTSSPRNARTNVFVAAAKVGGILANVSYPGDFIRENLLIQTNVIDAAYRYGVLNLMFFGSSCIYPKFASQPIHEDALLSGALESSNEAYAVAKIAGVKMVQAYRRQYGFHAICLMPTNLYGPGDNFALTSAHVVPDHASR